MNATAPIPAGDACLHELSRGELRPRVGAQVGQDATVDRRDPGAAHLRGVGVEPLQLLRDDVPAPARRARRRVGAERLAPAGVAREIGHRHGPQIT